MCWYVEFVLRLISVNICKIWNHWTIRCNDDGDCFCTMKLWKWWESRDLRLKVECCTIRHCSFFILLIAIHLFLFFYIRRISFSYSDLLQLEAKSNAMAKRAVALNEGWMKMLINCLPYLSFLFLVPSAVLLQGIHTAFSTPTSDT